MRSLNIYIHDLGELCAVSSVSEASLAFFWFLSSEENKNKTPKPSTFKSEENPGTIRGWRSPPRSPAPTTPTPAEPRP